MKWFDCEICVPFGNPKYDVGLGGPHDMDVQTPPNTPITALLAGTVVDIGEPTWGMVIGVKLDQPYKGIPYMAYLHLAAVNVKLGEHIVPGQLIAWSGGCNTSAQYAGTSNPTGKNFLNTPAMSSQPQAGIAIMRGPVYGSGAGWEAFPPVDWALDPTQLILDARKGETTMAIPANWKDDGTTLTAPNNVPVVHGFRQYVLDHAWNKDNWPLAAEYGTDQVEGWNQALGGGTEQIFRSSVLEWTKDRGVFEMWTGQELDYTRKQVAKYYNLAASAQAQVAQLQAQLAQLQQTNPDAIVAIHQAQALFAPFK